jgi:hypothetical protein
MGTAVVIVLVPWAEAAKDKLSKPGSSAKRRDSLDKSIQSEKDGRKDKRKASKLMEKN